MVVEYTLQPEDVAAARLLAIGIRPRLEFGLFVAALAALLIGSVSPWSYPSMPLLVGLTASLGGFRLMQNRPRETGRRGRVSTQSHAAAADGRLVG